MRSTIRNISAASNAAILGAYFALEMANVRHEERIIEVEALPDTPCHISAWDLGVQRRHFDLVVADAGRAVIVLDHYAASGVGVEHLRRGYREARASSTAGATASIRCRTMPR